MVMFYSTVICVLRTRRRCAYAWAIFDDGARMAMQSNSRPGGSEMPVYSATARKFHWWTAALVLIMLPLGFAMDHRANDLKIFDGLTNTMYSSHKLIGFGILWLMLARLAYRLRNGAPPSEPTLEAWQKGVSHATHWLLYLLLIVVPVGGWVAVSMYGSRDVFGLFSLPPIAAVDQKLSETVFVMHKIGAIAILLLVSAHIGAALYHFIVRKDGVLRRMLPSIGGST